MCRILATIGMIAMMSSLIAGCTDTPNRSCSWVGPGGRATYVCKPNPLH
jgi:hypothetical protein